MSEGNGSASSSLTERIDTAFGAPEEGARSMDVAAFTLGAASNSSIVPHWPHSLHCPSHLPVSQEHVLHLY